MAEGQSTITYRDIPGWPGYRVGDDGSVWSCWKKKGFGKLSGKRGLYSLMTEDWRQLKPSPDCFGYYCVTLVNGERPKQKMKVHILVMRVFVGPCPEGLEVCHGNGDQADNSLGNLRYDTHKSNADDCTRHGTRPRGSAHGQAKLNELGVREIRRLYMIGRVTMKELAREFGVHRSVIGDAVHRRTWKHV